MRVFIDTAYFLALANSGDQYHRVARKLSKTLEGPFLTTEAVLIEVANFLSKKEQRYKGIGFLGHVYQASNIELNGFTPELFQSAIQLYCARQDKDWSLTDCLSFVVMEERGLKEALTADRHFIEAGYRALMLE